MTADQRGCHVCRNGESADLEHLANADEYHEYLNGKAREHRTHYVCRLCGAKWVRTVESGAGGHGNFWSPE